MCSSSGASPSRRMSREDALVYCDSDVAFLKPFDCRRLLARRPGAAVPPRRRHRRRARATRRSGRKMPARRSASPASSPSPHDYIATLIAWRRETRRGDVPPHRGGACAGTGSRWSPRSASSPNACMYGRYVDEVIGGAGHFHGSEEFCRVQWFGDAAFRRRDPRLHRRDERRSRWRSACSPSSARISPSMRRLLGA